MGDQERGLLAGKVVNQSVPVCAPRAGETAYGRGQYAGVKVVLPKGAAKHSGAVAGEDGYQHTRPVRGYGPVRRAGRVRHEGQPKARERAGIRVQRGEKIPLRGGVLRLEKHDERL